MTDSMRAAFEAAFDKAEEEAQNSAPPEPIEPLPDPRAVDAPEGEPVTKPPEHEEKPPELETKPPELDAKAPERTTEQLAREAENAEKYKELAKLAGKAPDSWKPAARESWGKLPEETRVQIIKREQEVKETLLQTASARQAVTHLNDMLAPHKERMIASGVENPLKMLGDMLDAERRLSEGDAHTRAVTIANLIKGYKVDIGVLDNLLSGQGAPPNPNSDIERLIEQRLAPVNQLLQQHKYQTRQQELAVQQQAAETVEGFSSSAEFFEDVRMDMADLVDMAAARGQNMSLEDAYKKACAIHPEVSKVLADREAQARIMGTQNSLQQKKKAAVSITGAPVGGTVANPTNLRDQLSSAWDAQLN